MRSTDASASASPGSGCADDGERLRGRRGTEAAADLIERVAISGEPVEMAVAG